MDRRPEYWDRIAEEWGDDHPHAVWRCHSDGVNRRLLEGWLPGTPVKTLLKTDLFDEAVAEGLVPLLATKARRLVGIDVSTAVLARATRRFAALEATRADVRALLFGDGTFDVVVSLSTLDHFDSFAEIETGLHELYRVLKPGGQLILTLDNLANPVVRLRNAVSFSFLDRYGLVPYCPGATCGPRQLQCLAKRAGFDIADTTAILHCPRVVAVALSRWIGRWATARGQAAWLRFLGCFECLARMPTRFVTGHFIALRAYKTKR